MAIEDEFDPRAERIRSEQKNKGSYEAWIKTLAKDEGKSEAALMKQVLLQVAETSVKKHERLWIEALNKKNKILKDSIIRDAEGNIIEKHPVPDNYWQEEHKAHARLENAMALLGAIKEQ